ncbi:MAG: ATP-binding protein [Candidatus Margulisbacteria bacterium]|nr:ATP-binding protein [Candidatus Margulisiibacteriota bacterium]
MWACGGWAKAIFLINKELHEYDSIENYKDLLEYIKNKSPKRGKTYLFVDEVQEIEQVERAFTSLPARGGYDIYCTGSNAGLLSGELATRLSGRYLPYLIHLDLTDEIVYDYLRNIYDTVLLKDVVARHNIRKVAFLERLVSYSADNIGCLISAKRISDFLKSQRINISPNVVLDYLSFLSAAYFLFKVPRAEIIGKKVFAVGEKYYFEDLGLRHVITGYRQTDINKVLENLVFMHLKMSGYEVAVGQLRDKEIDFVAKRGGEKIYLQVAYLLPDQKAKEREFGNLLLIKDNYSKMVISMDELVGQKYQGIEQIHIREFLSKTI